MDEPLRSLAGLIPLPDGYVVPPRFRSAALARFGWSLPGRSSIRAIIAATGGDLVDCGSGSGLWAAVLEEAGCHVLAADDGSWGIRPAFRRPDMRDAAAAVLACPGTPVLLCYPPARLAEKVVRVVETGTTVVHVGPVGMVPSREYRETLSRFRVVTRFRVHVPSGMCDGTVFSS